MLSQYEIKAVFSQTKKNLNNNQSLKCQDPVNDNSISYIVYEQQQEKKTRTFLSF